MSQPSCQPTQMTYQHKGRTPPLENKAKEQDLTQSHPDQAGDGKELSSSVSTDLLQCVEPQANVELQNRKGHTTVKEVTTNINTAME